jgi:hypothetical protein
MLGRFALVIHWLFFLIGLAAGLSLLGAAGYEVIDRGINTDDFLASLIGSPFVFIGFTATGWTIRFILTGSKVIFPWSTPKESDP